MLKLNRFLAASSSGIKLIVLVLINTGSKSRLCYNDNHVALEAAGPGGPTTSKNLVICGRQQRGHFCETADHCSTSTHFQVMQQILTVELITKNSWRYYKILIRARLIKRCFFPIVQQSSRRSKSDTVFNTPQFHTFKAP